MKTIIKTVDTVITGVSNAFGASINFDSAFDILGFKDYQLTQDLHVTKERQEEALLNIFYMAGYFEAEKLWQNIKLVALLALQDQLRL
jgi:hypothetical protein